MEEGKRTEQGYYSYINAENADRAAAELERIARLEEQIDYSKPKVVHMLYEKALSGKVFKSPEGFAYLLHLREYLDENREFLDEIPSGIPEEILTAPVYKRDEVKKPEEKPDSASEKKTDENPDDKAGFKSDDKEKDARKDRIIKKLRRENRSFKKRLYFLRIAVISLLCAVVIMFIIAMTGDTPNMINYERTLQDKYATWEQELTQREKALKLRENNTVER